MLCEECEEIFSMELDEDTQYAHYGIIALEAEAKNECHLCLLVWHGISVRKDIMHKLQEWVTNNPGKDTSTYVMIRHDEIYPALEFIFRVDDGDSDVEDAEYADYDGFEISMEAMHGVDSLPAEDSAVRGAENTGSDNTMRTVTDWFQSCQEKHALCLRDLVKSKSLPSRLIQISGPSEQPTLRLCLSREIPADTPYVTLSHCWGNHPFFKLTAQNLGCLRQKLELTKLPPTFQEAVKVTQSLGIAHIWIDSLCIMQDSRNDWVREAARMADVYSNAQCNIAASASHDGSEGLFRARDSSLARPLNVWATWTGERLAEGPYTLVYADPFEVEILPEPLNRRAWVFQERILSRRVLHFGTHQVHWKCRENIASEAFPGTLPFSSLFATDDAWIESLFEDPHKDPKYNYYALATTTIEKRHQKTAQEHLEANLSHLRGSLYSAWTALVTEYSKCDLTFSSDRPLAISGIARAMATKLGDTDRYIAGLWRSRLVEMLLFARDTKAGGRPEPQRAPSWSWLARDGPVSFQGTLLTDAHETGLWRNHRLCEILQAAVEEEGGDAFSCFSTGTLRLRAFLASVSITRVRLTRQLLLWAGGHCVIDVADTYSHVRLDGAAELEMLACRDWHIVVFMQHDSARYGTHVHGLVLRPSGEAKGRFRRHGKFAIKSAAYGMLLAMQEDGTNWVVPECEEVDSAGQCILTIV